jgi:hypothetical protein
MEAARDAVSSWKPRVSSSCAPNDVTAIMTNSSKSGAEGSVGGCGQEAKSGKREMTTVAEWKYIATTGGWGLGWGWGGFD